MSDRRAELERLSDDELRAAARSLGLVLGPSVDRSQLLALLADEAGAEERPDDPDGSAEDPAVSFPTVSMARLYAEQGHPEEAVRVCRAVLSARPDESRALELIARLAGGRVEPERAGTLRRHVERSAAAGRGRTGIGAAPATSVPLPELDGLLVCPVSPTVLHACWAVADGGLARPRSRAGSDAALVLRLFSAWAGPSGVSRRTADTDVDGLRGSRFLEPCAAGALHRLALGLLAGESFVPIVHSAAVHTPRGRPSPLRRVALAPVLRPTPADRPARPAAAESLLARLAEELSMDLPWEVAGRADWPEPADSAPLPAPPGEPPPLSTSSPAGRA